MKISDLDVGGFGVWNGLHLNDISDQVTVVYGPNEAGKTTLMEFIRTVLYGFSDDRRHRYLPPLSGGRGGGSLHVAGHEGRYEIRRGGEPSGDGSLAVLGTDGSDQGQRTMELLLGGIDEQIFNNVFAVGLRELQELATLNDTDAAKQLYALAGGLDRVSLFQVVREVESARKRILDKGGGPSLITQLLEKREQLSAAVEQQSENTRDWTCLATDHGELERDIRSLQAELEASQQRAQRVELAITVRPQWRKRAAIAHQIDMLGPLPELPDDGIERLDRYGERIAKHLDSAKQIKTEANKLRAEAKALPINQTIWRNQARVEALGEQQEWIASLQQQTQSLHTEVSQLDAELQTEQQRIGVSIGPAGASSGVNVAALSQLRGPARTLSAEKKRLAKAKQELSDSRAEAQTLTGEVEAALATRGEQDLNVALDKASSLVTKLRRRVELDERLSEMKRNESQLESQSHELLEQQVLPPWLLFIIGALFVIGVMLLLTGIFGGLFFDFTGEVGWALAFLGIGGTIAAVFTKTLYERSAVEQLSSCHRQIEVIETQTERARRERDDLDRELPMGGGSLVGRLRDAESDLATLERLRPIENRRQTDTHRAEAAQRRVVEIANDYKTARRRWQSALSAAGLPETLSPSQVRSISARYDQLDQLSRRFDTHRDNFEQRQRELSAVTARIDRLVKDAKLASLAGTPLERLEQLLTCLNNQQGKIKRRRAIQKQVRELRKKYNARHKVVDKLARRRRVLIADADVETEEEFRELSLKLARAEELRDEYEQQTTEILSAILDKSSEEDIAVHLDRLDDQQIDKSLETLWDNSQALETRLRQCYERRGQLREQLKSLGTDRKLAEARLELSCIEKQLVEAVEKWQVYSATSKVLDTICVLYESERQPETLQEASTYLSRFTEGRYSRVWTPLGEDMLRVDDGNGKSLPIDLLSCGTREQVFLSLRLALVAAYARRGIRLPVVLDDVLVNFDFDRAKAAVKMLRDFAKQGHQLLVFTCHAHVMKMFKNIKVDVRELPTRWQAETVAVEETSEPIIEEPPVAVIEIAEVIEEEVEEEVEEVEALEVEAEEEEYEEEESEEEYDEEEYEEVAEDDEDEYYEEEEEVEAEADDEELEDEDQWVEEGDEEYLDEDYEEAA